MEPQRPLSVARALCVLLVGGTGPVGGFVCGEKLCGLEPHSQLLMLCLLFRPISLYQEVIL